MTLGPYSRVYHCITDDPRFATVIGDDAAGWTWVRLLVIAEQAWPASAYLPRWVRPRPLAVLIAAGIVEREGDKYRIHGLDAERQGRSDHARGAANVRWGNAPGNAGGNAPGNAGGNAPGNAQAMLVEKSRVEHRRDERELGSTEALGAVGRMAAAVEPRPS